VRRRGFITLLGGAAGWPLAARAQPTRVARIGYVSGTGSAADRGPFVEALQQGMREHGYVDGKDFIVEYRGAEGRQARVPELVAELVQAKVDVLVAPIPTAIRAAKQATDTIPIVMVTSIDPVVSGIIDSLAKPGGNITGLFTLTRDLSAKRLEFLKGRPQRHHHRPNMPRTEMPNGFRIDTPRLLPRYFGFTLDVMELITLDAILSWSARFSIPCRRAIQPKSV
jgi:hypothetical protein